MIASIVATLLFVLLTLSQDSHTVQVAVGPITVDGDAASRIVTSTAGDDTLLVAGDDGLYEDTDLGWKKFAPAPPPGELVSGGAQSGLLLAGDHEPCGRGGSILDLQRSTDGGQTWRAVDGATGFRPLAIWPDRDLAVASSCLGLHLSLDAGLTWGPVSGIEPGWEVTSFAAVPQTDDSGPVVLVGLTGEGGTSYLRSIDFTDPAAPAVSQDLRTYYAVGGLAGEGDTYVLAAMDGVWISDDAGTTWERSAEGIEEIVLEQDPAEAGLPAGFDPSAFGLSAVSTLPGERPGLVLGAVDGLYVRYDDESTWVRLEGTARPVDDLAVSGDGTRVLYATGDGIFGISIVTGIIPCDNFLV